MGQFELLKRNKFAALFWTQFLGAFNDNFLKNALVILVTYKVTSLLGIPSSELVVASGGIFILPFFLFSATAGQLADKYEKTKIIRIIKLAEIGIMLLSAIGLLIPCYEILLLTLFLMGLHSTFFGPVKYSILPQHLNESELVGGNAIIEAGTFLAILLGTIGGGVLISVGNGGAYLVSGGLVLVAVLGYFASRFIPLAPATDVNIKVEWNPITPTWKIIRLTRKNHPVFLSILGISWFWFFGAAMLSLFPHYCKDTLKASEGVVTLFLAIFSIGIAIGSLLCERLSRKRLELGLVPIGSIGITLATLDLFFIGVPDFGKELNVSEFLQTSVGMHIAITLLALSVLSGFFIVPLYTMVQERSDPAFRSRIIAANNIVNAFFMVAASCTLLLLVSLGLNVPQLFLCLAVMNGIVAFYIYTLLPEFLFRFIAWILANTIYHLKVRGDEHLPKEGPALIISNHISFVDWLIIASAVKRPVRFVMDYRFAGNWMMKRFMKRAKVILIATSKEDPSILQSAFDQISKELEEGELVCIFPEGKITRDGRMSIFKPGMEKILQRNPVPVIPMAILGMWGSLFSRERGRALWKIPKRFLSRIELRIAAPVPAEQATAVAMKDAVAQLGNLK